jgi:hypothetical protein
MLNKYEWKVSTNEDIDKLSISKDQKINSIMIDFKGGVIDKTKFNDFFQNKLSLAKTLETLELDLTNYELDNQAIENICKTLKAMDNLKEFNLHISETKLWDEQFEKLLCESIGGKKSLTKLHLIMENVNMTDNKRKCIEKLVKSLPNLNYVHINLQRNQLTQTELSDLHNMIFHFPHRVLLW